MNRIRNLGKAQSWCRGPVAVAVFCAAASISTSSGANRGDIVADPLSVYTEERIRFVGAREALANGDRAGFDQWMDSLDGYPLQDHLHFERLQRDWVEITPGAREIDSLNEFEQRSGNSSLTRRLTRLLQRRFAATEQWQTFLGISQSRLAASMKCTHLKARYELGMLKGFDEASLELWVQPRKHPEICATVLSTLEADHTPPVPAIWEKINLAMEEDKPDYATPLLGYLASADRALVRRWISSAKDPEPFLRSGALSENTVLNRRIVADLAIEWSKSDTIAAMDYWLSVRNKYTFYEERYYDTHRAIAMRSAYRRMPEAYQWLYSFDANKDDLELQEWRIRTALLAEDWPAVRSSIRRLPQEEQDEDHWAYWEARALEKLGQAPAAQMIYKTLATLQSYHGFLSADRLGMDYSLRDEPMVYDSEVLAALAKDPQLIRAREFLQVDMPAEARREWNNWLLSTRTEEQLSAAAVLAQEWSLHDRAIYTAAKTEQKRALSVRFPVLYRTEVAMAAEEHGIEPSWIYGVMRRESAYIQDVQSGAGAVGLMQLMPNTARYVAELQGDKNWRGDLTDATTNIGFGSFYLRHVMDKFDGNQVMATAGYNAGPHRVDSWLGERAQDADIWIDTIPFTETRRYVRAVLAYAAIYEFHLMGKAQTMSGKLRQIPAAPEV